MEAHSYKDLFSLSKDISGRNKIDSINEKSTFLGITIEDSLLIMYSKELDKWINHPFLSIGVPWENVQVYINELTIFGQMKSQQLYDINKPSDCH